MAVTIKGFASDWSVPEPAKATLDGLYDKVDPQGRQPVRKGELFLNVRDFGAKGDGVTDDTAAFQSFVDRITNTPGAGRGETGYIPAGKYMISSTIVFPARPSWAIRGAHRDVTRIVQKTDNIPIFDLGGSPASYLHSYEVTGLTLEYANNQPDTNTNANAIVWSSEPYQANFSNLTFKNGYYGMAVRAGVGAPWGHNFDNLWFKGDLTGGAITMAGSINGIPNNFFGRVFVEAVNMTNTVFYLNQHSCTMGSIEVNWASKGARLFYLMNGGTLDIGSMKLENGTYSANTSLFEVSHSAYVRIGNLTCSGHTMRFLGGTCYFLNVANNTTVDIGYLDLIPSAVDPAAKVYAIGGGGAVNINTYKLGPLVSGLVNNGGTSTAELTHVRQHANNKLSANKADADYTIALGDPTKAMFATPFTVPRTVNLPNKNDNLFNGLTYEFIFRGAINSANTATIKCGNTTLHTQASDKAVVGFTYRRHPFDPAQGWTLTKYETLP